MTLGNFILPLIILTCLSCARKEDNSQIKTVLRELDETIDNRQRFENETQVKIARLKEELTKADSPEYRIDLYSSLFEQYKNYQYDSAFVYAKLMEKYAFRENPGKTGHTASTRPRHKSHFCIVSRVWAFSMRPVM